MIFHFVQREAEGKAFAVQQDAAANRDKVVMEAEAKARAVTAIAEALKTGGRDAATAVQLTLAKECVSHCTVVHTALSCTLPFPFVCAALLGTSR